ncbi:MAG: hypothetical protein QGG42_20230 [Phycisphaerae bacterium]|jgi:hypothetical protein|nr:hypothetical protein [Phycisphaerae bacterium]
MNRHLTTLLAVLLLGGSVAAKYTRRSKTPAKPPPDLCKNAVDPYRPSIQKSLFFQAAGADNELTESEFNADRSKPNGFARKFDSWRAMTALDKDANKTIDWIEADAYRYDLRKRVLAAYDANSDGKLSGAERTKANTDLLRGRIASPPKSSKYTPPHTTRSGDSGGSRADEAERERLKAQLYAIRKKLYYSPAMTAVRKACDAAERAYENAKKAPVVAEARKPYDTARAAYEKARDKLPEAQTYEKAKQAYYAAYRKTPEYKAYYAAREMLQRAEKDRKNYASARSAYERAKSKYEAAKAALPQYREYKDAREALDRAAHSSGEYKESQDAESAYRKVYEKHLVGERKARDDAQKARDAKLDQLLRADPTARDLYKRIKEIEARRK